MPTDHDLRDVIRDYLEVSDAIFRQEMRDGLLDMKDAKQETAEIEKWRELLAVMEGSK